MKALLFFPLSNPTCYAVFFLLKSTTFSFSQCSEPAYKAGKEACHLRIHNLQSRPKPKYSRVINLLTSPTTFRADTKKCCDKELSVTSVPDTCDYKRSSVSGLGQPCWDWATLPPGNIPFEKRFPTPSSEMTFLSQCVQLQNEATNGFVSIPTSIPTYYNLCSYGTVSSRMHL